MRLYLAGALSTFPQIRTLAKLLEGQGHRVVSSWQDVVYEGQTDPVLGKARQQIAMACCDEIDLADVVIVRVHEGAPRGTYFEAGYAIAKGKPVIWLTNVQHMGCPAFDSHPASIICQNEADLSLALAAISGLQ